MLERTPVIGLGGPFLRPRADEVLLEAQILFEMEWELHLI